MNTGTMDTGAGMDMNMGLGLEPNAAAVPPIGGFGGPAGLCDRLGVLALNLRDTALSLKDALIRKSNEEIWRLLAQHQSLEGELEGAARLWKNMLDSGVVNPEDPQIALKRAKVRLTLDELRAIERGNARLANGFLAALRKFFRDAGMMKAPKSGLYNSRGRLGGPGVSVLVSKTG